ncbi:MAG: carbohydrate ABC transporter permease [Acidimicrobiia bacterium]
MTGRIELEPAPSGQEAGRRRATAGLGSTKLLPYWLILPTVVYVGAFFAWPMSRALTLAFRDEDTWTLEFFRTMIGDANFTGAFWFTLLLLVVIIPIQFLVALAMALLVNSRLRARGLFLYIYALPLAISELAAGIVWFAIFTEQGYLNTVLGGLGLQERPFIWLDFRRPELLVMAVVLAEVWRATSLIMIILVAGLQGIARDYLEAAEVFGAGLFKRVWKVILPMLKPSLQVALILRTILAFQVFATVIAITGRGATVLTAEAWRWQTSFLNPNVAAAYAAVILLLSLGSTAIILGAIRTPPEQRLV